MMLVEVKHQNLIRDEDGQILLKRAEADVADPKEDSQDRARDGRDKTTQHAKQRQYHCRT